MTSMQTEEDLIIACAMNEVIVPDVTHLTVLPDEEDPAEAEISCSGPAIVGDLVGEDEEWADDDLAKELQKAVDMIQDCRVLFHLLPMIELKKIMVAQDWWEVIKLERRLINFLDQWEQEQKENNK